MMNFIVKQFKELSTDELYEVLRLRSEVFVVEQTCYYQDMDDRDRHPEALHVLGYQDEQLAAYLRVLPKGTTYSDYPSVGRVVIGESVRGQGAGHVLIECGIEACELKNPQQGIKISAQSHLQAFYRRHGFDVVSEEYLEDGIPHISMLRKPE
ncbi:GNAT family N-acetyltransferase [Vibrio profundum]|uniref:GNAT family N-acetyltransferase n=1 Tax=Vibrio profundum TaxID=2910247 RepID=UPI003D0A7144